MKDLKKFFPHICRKIFKISFLSNLSRTGIANFETNGYVIKKSFQRRERIIISNHDNGEKAVNKILFFPFYKDYPFIFVGKKRID